MEKDTGKMTIDAPAEKPREVVSENLALEKQDY